MKEEEMDERTPRQADKDRKDQKVKYMMIAFILLIILMANYSPHSTSQSAAPDSVAESASDNFVSISDITAVNPTHLSCVGLPGRWREDCEIISERTNLTCTEFAGLADQLARGVSREPSVMNRDKSYSGLLFTSVAVFGTDNVYAKQGFLLPAGNMPDLDFSEQKLRAITYYSDEGTTITDEADKHPIILGVVENRVDINGVPLVNLWIKKSGKLLNAITGYSDGKFFDLGTEISISELAFSESFCSGAIPDSLQSIVGG